MKKIFKHISTIFLFTVSILSSSVYATNGSVEEAIDCVDPKIMSQKIGKFEKGEMEYTPCGDFLRPFDTMFLRVATVLIDRDTFTKMETIVRMLGGDYELMLPAFSEHNAFQNTLSIAFKALTPMIAIFIFCLMVTARKEDKSKAAIATLILGLILLGSFSISKYSAYCWLFITSHYNEFLWNAHDIEQNLEYFTDGETLRLSTTAIEESDEQFSNMLHAISAIDVATDNRIRTSNYGSSIEVDFDFRSNKSNDIAKPTIAQYLEMQDECSLKDRAEVSENVELNFTTLADTGLLSLIPSGANLLSIPYKAEFFNGGETYDYNCPEREFGFEKGFASIQINHVLLAQHLMSKKHADEVADQTTMIEDIADAFSNDLAYMEKEFVDVDVVAGQQLENIEGKLMLSHAIALQSQSTGEDYKLSSQYESLVAAYKGTFNKVFSYNQDRGFTIAEQAQLNAIKMGIAKFSSFFSNTKGMDPKLMYNLNGWHYAKPFISKTVRMNMAVDCAINHPSSYIHRQKYAQEWNAIDKTSVKNASMKSLGGGFDYACFIYEDGMLNADYSDPESINENIKEITARKKAVEIMLSAISEAVFQLSVNNPEMFEDAKLEYINSIEPTMQSVVQSRFGFMEMKQDLQNVFATVEELYSFDLLDLIDDLTLPQTFYNYHRFSKDVLTGEDISNIDKVYRIGKYNLSTTFKGFVKGQTNEPVSTSLEVGILSLLGDKLNAGTCPIRDEEGNCKASLQELNYASNSKMLNIALTITAARTAIKVARATGNAVKDVADTSDKTVIGKSPQGKLGGLIGGAFFAVAVSLDIAFGWLFDVLFVFSWLAVFLGKVAMYIPLIAELSFVLFGAVYLLVSMLLLAVVPLKEMTMNIARMAMGEKDFEKIANFDGTINILKSTIIRWVIFFGAIYLFLFLHNSSGIGGAFYTLMISVVDDNSVITTLLYGFVMSIAYIFALFKTITVVNSFEDSILKKLNVDGGATFQESNNAIGSLVGFATGRLWGQAATQGRMLNVGADKMGAGFGNTLKNKLKDRNKITPTDGKE